MSKLPEVITEAEFITLIKKDRRKHHKLAFALGFYACMRISEVVNLKKEDVDRGQRLIRIKQGKGGKDRNIPIPPKVVPLLKYLPVRVTPRALQICFKGYARSVLNKDLHFHTLRHSGATHYLNKRKWNIRQVQQLLGHSRLDTTMIYTHVTPDDLIDKMWDDLHNE